MTFDKETIGCVGHGFVGEALQVGMKHAYKVLVHDPFKYPKGCLPEDEKLKGKGLQGYAGFEIVETISELASRSEVIFVAVPTPMNPDGSASTRIVENVVVSIAEHACQNVVVIKSTVPPGTTQRLHRQFGPHWKDGQAFGGLNKLRGVVFNPEFLTEANYLEDFKNQDRIILGCEDDGPKTVVKSIYQRAYPNVPTIKTHPTIAELVKYTTNCFLATKVSLANELKQICDELSVDYDKVIEYATLDERLGRSHWAVPGPDGKAGWGLSCFPKDLNALMAKARELGVDPKVMSAVWQKNLEVRDDKDWERMPKAVVEVKGESKDAK